MKITIQRPLPEPEVKLWLEQSGETVLLKGMDQNGRLWTILRVTELGITRIINIGALGWPLDNSGQFKVIE